MKINEIKTEIKQQPITRMQSKIQWRKGWNDLSIFFFLTHCSHSRAYKIIEWSKKKNNNNKSMIIAHYQVFNAFKFHLFQFFMCPISSFIFSSLHIVFILPSIDFGHVFDASPCARINRKLYNANIHGTHVSVLLNYHRCKIVKCNSISCCKKKTQSINLPRAI